MKGVRKSSQTPRETVRQFQRLLEGGARLLPAGEAAREPELLLTRRHLPRFQIDLFGATFFLTDFRYEEGLNFLVAYVALPDRRSRRIRRIFPRIFYKDSSLLWRVASHMIRKDGENWIGKGDVKWERDKLGDLLVSDEDSTNLPYEIQSALEEISRKRDARRDLDAARLILRNAPIGRLEPYADFTRSRRAIHGGRPIARLLRRGDPSSLRFASGFEPDFSRGFIELERSTSRLYGGAVQKYRFLSTNRSVQYQLVASSSHVWINPPQSLSRELTSYGLRALHVKADDEIFIPGLEYHFLDETVDPPALHTQIPNGFAGPPSPIDPSRADASAWIEKLPVIQAFRARVLRRNKRRRRVG